MGLMISTRRRCCPYISGWAARAASSIATPPTRRSAADARNIAADAGVPFDSMHGLFGPQYDPASPVESTRKFAVETYKAEGELSLQLGGPVRGCSPFAQRPGRHRHLK